MSKKIKIKPKLNKSANSDWEIVDDVSMKGYSDNSPYRDRKSIDIHSPNGLIDMSETGMPILANGKFLSPYSGMHQFEPGVVREERIMQNGGRQPIVGTPRQEQAYRDSLFIHNDGERMRNLLINPNTNENTYTNEVNRYYTGTLLNTNNPTNQAISRLNRLNNELPVADTIQNRTFPSGYTAYASLFKKPVQPIVIGRPKDPTLQLNQGQQLLPESSKNINFNPIPYGQGTYFSRPRQQQEIGGTEYFDKKTGKPLGKFQDGGGVKDKYNTTINSKIVNSNESRSRYDSRFNEILLGEDYKKATPEQQERMVAHEGFHSKQFADGKSRFIEYKDIPYKRPSIVSTDENYDNYHNRKQVESDIDINNFTNQNPSFKFVPKQLVFNNIVDNQQYDNPYSLEGEATYYENSGEIPPTYQNGGNTRGTINKLQDGGKTSQWEILPEAEDGKKISLEDFMPKNPNSNERIQQEIINKDALNRVTKGTKENPVNLEEITVSAPRNRNPVTAQAAATRWKEENPELQGSSADLASAMFLAPVGEFSHTPSRVLNYGVGAYKNQDLRFNPYKSELSETLGLETNPDDPFHSVRNFFVDNAADFAAPSIIKSFGKGLNKSINYVDDINSINKELKFIRENGLSKGLSEKQIKSLQMEKVGITDNQRKAFTPVLSDALSKYVKPISYEEGVISKLKDIPKNIKQGGWKNDPYFKDYAHTGKREDAWNLYLGKPQKNNTFRYSETVPKSMYYPELKNNLDIYNLNYEDDLADFVKYMDKSKTSKYSDLVSGNTIYPSDAGVMGGYNLTRVDGNFPNIGKGIVEYNDIWDLHPKTTMRSLFPKPIANNTWLNDNVFYKKNPNGSFSPREIELKMENFIGKPFMSHGRVPVEFESLPNAFKTYSDKEQKLIDFTKMAKGYKFKSGGKVNTDWEIIQD